MLKEIYFGLQIALLFLSGCAACDMWYRGILPGVYAAVIIIACIMSLYSSLVFYSRTSESRKRK